MKQLITILILVLGLYTAGLAQNNQTDDVFTIVTYYPSPQGYYRQMDIYRGITFHHVDQNSLTNPAPNRGELVYNATADQFYYYNSSNSWEPLGGGGTAEEVTTESKICNSTAEASVKYNATSKNLEFCDGTTWQPVAPLSTGMVAGRVTITNFYSSCYGQSCTCSAAAPGVCNGGTSGSGATACAAITAGCKAGWSVFLQADTSTTGNACAYPATNTKVYYCSYG